VGWSVVLGGGVEGVQGLGLFGVRGLSSPSCRSIGAQVTNISTPMVRTLSDGELALRNAAVEALRQGGPTAWRHWLQGLGSRWQPLKFSLDVSLMFVSLCSC
jgi:hypothetical protein